MNDPHGLSATELAQFILARQTENKSDFRGAVFRPANNVTFRFAAAVQVTDLRGSRFGDGASLSFDGPADISGSVAEGFIQIAGSTTRLAAHEVTFEGNAAIYAASWQELDFSGSRFHADAEFQLARPRVLNLERCRFKHALAIRSAENQLPQNTSFRDVRFSRRTAFGAGAEGRYRSIRNALHNNRDREQEGFFYSLEKRARRKNLGWGPRAWLPRSLSALYDWTTGYGQSFEWAAAWFAAVQLSFGLLYSVMSGRFQVPGQIDSQIIAFTSAQVVKPFETLSGRELTRWPYEGVIDSATSGLWTLATASHSVLSLALLALFFLALRWRFRRD